MMRRALRSLNALAFRGLPPMAYVGLAARAIPLVDPARRGSGVRFARDGARYLAHRPDGTYAFNSAFKVGRFLYPGEAFGARILARYASGAVAVAPGDVVVDIGANIGEFSVAAGRTAARVLALEPDPSAFDCLARNTAAQDHVTPRAVAVTEADGPVTFYLAPGTSDSSLLRPEIVADAREVEGRRLATLMAEEGLSRIDFLKLEAEGFEPEILRASVEVLPCVRKVAVDASPERHGAPTGAACVEILRAQGFEVWQEGWMVFALNPAAGSDGAA